MRVGVAWSTIIDEVDSPAREPRNVSVLRTGYETDGPTLPGEILPAFIHVKVPLIPMSYLRPHSALDLALQDVDQDLRDETFPVVVDFSKDDPDEYWI